MTRLIDDLRDLHRLKRPRVVQKWLQLAWKAYDTQLWPILKDPDLMTVSINGVATYYFETSKRERWNLANTEHFPDLTPPRPYLWFEYRIPQRIHSEIGDTDLRNEPFAKGRAGALVLRCRPEDVAGSDIPFEATWILMIDTFFDYGIKPGEIEGPHGAWALAIDSQGQILDVPSCQSFTGNNREAQRVAQASVGWLHPPLLALSWLPREIPEEMKEINL